MSGLALDAAQNLWIANYGANGNLHVKTGNDNFYSIHIPFPLSENAVSQLVTDDFHQVWIVSPKNHGLICFHYGKQIDNPGDDQWKWYRSGKSNGNLPGNDVRQIAIDGATGEVFFATTKGLYSYSSTATEGGPEHSNVKVFPNPVPPGYAGAISTGVYLVLVSDEARKEILATKIVFIKK